MTGCRITVEVNGAGFLENAAQFDEARGHHRQVGHHVGVEEEGFEGTQCVGDAATRFNHFLVGASGVGVPLPSILEGMNLGARLRAVLLGEEDVVILAGVERRVKIDEIDGLVFDVAPENIEVISVI
jgi:hypothetical protein